jgi:hypothetical protein
MSDGEKIVNSIAENILVSTLKQSTVEDRKKWQVNYGIDPLTIILIISVTLTLIRVIQECRKNKSSLMTASEKNNYLTSEVRTLSFGNSFLTRRKVKKILKEKLTKEQYNKYGDALFKSLLTVGKTVTDEQVSALVEYKENV